MLGEDPPEVEPEVEQAEEQEDTPPPEDEGGDGEAGEEEGVEEEEKEEPEEEWDCSGSFDLQHNVYNQCCIFAIKDSTCLFSRVLLHIHLERDAYNIMLYIFLESYFEY